MLSADTHDSEPTPLQIELILRNGLAAGLIGATSVAVWFLVIDTLAGRPFYTPGVLGSALALGVRDPSAAVVNLQSVGTYTLFHVFAFLVVGGVAAVLAAEAERSIHVLWWVAEFFLVFEFAFHAAVGLVFTPLLAQFAWINVAVGNLIAAATMGWYLWRAYPRIAQRLAAARRPPEEELP